MIIWNKKRGETPLQALDRLRLERPELAEETLSYAGRLDPMAEGVLMILVGKEENQNRKEFLYKDKEYKAEFLIGCATDTHDVLGIHTRTDFKKIPPEHLIDACNSFTTITEQTYPWYSSRTVDGIALFEYARAGNTDIVRPTREVQIFSVTDIKVEEKESQKLIAQNISDIASVVGDFRQKECAASWEKISKIIPEKVQFISCTLKVSSGTYIRSLTEYLEAQLGVPTVLQKLIRTQIF